MAARVEVPAKREEVLEQLRRVAPRSRNGRGHVLDPAAIKWVLRRLDPMLWTRERISSLLAGLERDQDGRVDCEAFVDAIYGSSSAPANPPPQELVPKEELKKKSSAMEDMARTNLALQEELRTLRGQVTETVQKAASKEAELKSARQDVVRCQDELDRTKAAEQLALDRLAQAPFTLPMLPTAGPVGRKLRSQHPASSKRAATLMGSVLFALSKRGISNASDAFRFFAGRLDVKEVSTEVFQRTLRGLNVLSQEDAYFLMQCLDPEMLGVVKFRPFRGAMATFLSQSAEIHRILPDDQYNALLIRIRRQLADKGFCVEDAFRDVDRGPDVCISCREFVAGLRGLRIGMAEKELVQLFDALVHRASKGKPSCRASSKASSKAESGAPSRASSKASSCDSDAPAQDTGSVHVGGSQQLPLDALSSALAAPSAAQSKLRDWAAHNFDSITRASVRLLAQRHAEPPEFERLHYMGFKALMAELSPDMAHDDLCRLWAFLSKDDDSKEPVVRVSELPSMLQMRPGPDVVPTAAGPPDPGVSSTHLAPAAAVHGGAGRRRSSSCTTRPNAALLPDQRMRFGVLWGGLTPSTSSPAVSVVGSPSASSRRGRTVLPSIVGVNPVEKPPRASRSYSPRPPDKP